MIKVNFSERKGTLCGFYIRGHANAGTEGNDIVCASVSSAAYLVANTITDVMHVEAEISVREGNMRLLVPEREQSACLQILEGLRLHITELSKEYPDNITVSNSEV